MKTKYIKVSVSEKDHPDEVGIYQTSHGELTFSKFLNEFITENGEIAKVDFFMLEVPDREDEMKELLKEIYPLLMERHLYESGQKIQKILNEIYLTN